MAQRADKWWRSVWHVQMCMFERGVTKPLTLDVGRAFLKAKTNETPNKPNPGRSGNTNGETT